MNFREYMTLSEDATLGFPTGNTDKKKGKKGKKDDKHVVHQGAELGDDGKPLAKKGKESA